MEATENRLIFILARQIFALHPRQQRDPRLVAPRIPSEYEDASRMNHEWRGLTVGQANGPREGLRCLNF